MEFNNFVAEDQLIEIIPRFNYQKKLNLLCGEFGKLVDFIPLHLINISNKLLNGERSFFV